MTTGMLHDTMQSPSGLGPRFRPYASPNHQVTKGRYITSNDPRGYIPVYEYPLNGQWIMMDIDDGYILWTGIWKALGNSKADIVKMTDSHPDLVPLIRRVRGGYLKIQGTWMPYEVALRLSRRVAWPIRDDLIPLFGPTFPSTCLSPDQPGYGQVVASGTGRRRARRNNQTATAAPSTPRESQVNWTIVTPNSGPTTTPSMVPAFPSSGIPSSSRYPDPHYSPDQRSHFQRGYQHPDHMPFAIGPSSSTPPDPTAPRGRGDYSRYAPYPGPSVPQNRKQPASSRGSLSLDIPSLSLHERASDSVSQPRVADGEQIMLPPIQAPSNPRNSTQSPYALPPISALEDLRGIHTYDSAAVLRRLQSDDDSYSEPERPTEEQLWTRRRSLSAPPYKIPADNTVPWSQQSTASHPSRSFQEQPNYRYSPRSGNETSYYSRLSLGIPSDPSHDGNSTCDASPVSPSTPRSAASARENHIGLVPLSVLKEQGRRSVPTNHTFPGAPLSFNRDYASDRGASRSEIRDAKACRQSCGEESDNDSNHPLRPW